MTNYNKRLDELLETIIAEAFIFGNLALGKGVDVNLPDNNHELPPKEKAKQAITSLIKELVAKAKPDDFLPKGHHPDACLNHEKYTSACCGCQKQRARLQAINEFEQNLLKALEEV